MTSNYNTKNGKLQYNYVYQQIIITFLLKKHLHSERSRGVQEHLQPAKAWASQSVNNRASQWVFQRLRQLFSKCLRGDVEVTFS